MTTRKFDICMWTGPGTSIANPYLRAMQYLSSTYCDLEINWSGNWSHYSNERADEILAALPYETDADALKAAYTELSQIWLDEVPSFAAMYNAVTGHSEQFREADGKAFHVAQGFWTSNDPEDFAKKYTLGSSLELNAYNFEDLYNVCAVYNENANLDELKALAAAYTYEEVAARRGIE